MDKNIGAYIVSWDFSHSKDHDILLVGEKTGKNVKIVNAFQGQEARYIFEKLSTVKTKEAQTNE